MLRYKFKIVITLVLMEDSLNFSRYPFLATKNHALNNKHQDVVVHFMTF